MFLGQRLAADRALAAGLRLQLLDALIEFLTLFLQRGQLDLQPGQIDLDLGQSSLAGIDLIQRRLRPGQLRLRRIEAAQDHLALGAGAVGVGGARQQLLPLLQPQVTLAVQLLQTVAGVVVGGLLLGQFGDARRQGGLTRPPFVQLRGDLLAVGGGGRDRFLLAL